MEETPPSRGFNSGLPGGDAPQQSGPVWRPWTGNTENPGAQNAPGERVKPAPITHPVKLFWPRSRCFDYLYRDAESLLRNYPVQATISVYEEPSSEEDSEEEEEEDEKEQN
ncbi:protein ripply2-like [Antennarius striatus]|uniref:protein ripply2-like n=1 Tax=Antennarius striatus TaxID=241820 RepID=UPI0035B3237A